MIAGSRPAPAASTSLTPTPARRSNRSTPAHADRPASAATARSTCTDCLTSRHQMLPGRGVVRLELPDHAAGAHPGDADEHVQQVVEAGRRVVLDLLRAHHQLRIMRLVLQQAEVAQVLDPCAVEVRHVPAVVDDALRVRLVEPDPCAVREAEGRAAVVEGRHDRITESTSSRRRSIASSDSASRFSRSSGSVFDGRTLKCQSGYSTEMPSRCETRRVVGRTAPSAPRASPGRPC